MSLLIGDIVTLAALTAPRQTAATLGAEAITFAELDVAANRTANALAARGIQGGDVVLWCAAPTLRVLDVFVACARLGAVFAPVNPGLPQHERDAVRGYLDPRIVLSDMPFGEAGVVHHDTLDNGSSVFDRRAVDDTTPPWPRSPLVNVPPPGAARSQLARWLTRAPLGVPVLPLVR